MDLILKWLPTLITVLVWVAIFFARNWIIAKIKAGVEHDFNSKLEGLKSELRSKENEIASLRDTVLTGRNQRQALVDKRKIDAVDYLWKGVVELQRFKPLSNAMVAIDLARAEGEASKDVSVRKFFEEINSRLAPKIEDLKPNEAINQRPFVSSTTWAYFSALQTILYGSFLRAKMLEIGVGNASKYMKTEHEKKILKAALPHKKEFIDKYDAFSYFYLVDELEDKLLKELNNILDGKASDQESIETAADIQRAIKKMSADNALSSSGI
jgi:hypothetical protein